MFKLFSVFDSKVGAYLPCMTMRSAGEAIRAFGSACCDTGHDFFKYAEDYTLFEMGEWDELSGTLIPHPSPLSLCKGIELSTRHKDFYYAVREKLA